VVEAAQTVSSQTSEMPRVANAQLETRQVSASLDATMRELAQHANTAQWVG
jgi:hypothetical protein